MPTIRELAPHEHEPWDALAGRPGALTAARAQDEVAPHPSQYLVAFEGERPVAALRLGLEDALTVLRTYAEARPDPALRLAFAAHLAASVATELLAWDRGSTAALLPALEAVGFTTAREKVFVERELVGLELPQDGAVSDGLELCTYEALGPRAFATYLGRARAGDPFEPVGGDAEAACAELVRDAGAAWDPREWFVAQARGEPVGVVLPQPYPDDPRGTLFYVGVFPERRGRGLGVALHRLGLRRLAARGAASYVGSTDARNAPMRRVFARNGCRETKRQRFLRPPAREQRV